MPAMPDRVHESENQSRTVHRTELPVFSRLFRKE